MKAGLTAAVLLIVGACSGCASTHVPEGLRAQATLSPSTLTSSDLSRLPEPKGKIVAAIYALRDQTGQFKTAPDSSFSTAVTQGASSILVKALLDSRWFTPVERENLQDLLTERKIARALEIPHEEKGPTMAISSLAPASVLIEGGIIGYETNVRTGGAGVRFLGVGVSDKYRTDQVSVNLRAVDTRDGKILSSISTTKTIYSVELSTGVFRFVNFKDLLEVEAGITRNEPVQLCVREAIESAVIHLIVDGIKGHVWHLKNAADISSDLIRSYLQVSDKRRDSNSEASTLNQTSIGGEKWRTDYQ